MSKLLDFVPSVNRNNKELMSLYNIHKEELEKFEAFLKQIFKNLFLETADGQGVSMYEAMLGITGSGNLQSRKNLVLLKLSSRPPYTENAIKSLCESIYGVGNFKFTVYSDICAVIFEAHVDNPEDFMSFNRELMYMIPANILMIFVMQYLYLWLNENMTYGELTENEKYTYAELSKYYDVYKPSNPMVSDILARVVKYAYYWLSHNVTYKELSENSLYTYAELSKSWLEKYQYSWLLVNFTYKDASRLTYQNLSQHSF